ncbi:MAG TPA: YjbE family putative metal transport protein [Nitrospirota bacterium]|nr:YjbE family putative metal transport protein [Nitrospirota bacterium]
MIDFGSLGSISFDLAFLSALFSIVIIDLILAGDNAVVIAMAVRALPHDQRKQGIIFGAAAAVLLRVILTFFVAQLLSVGYVKLAGGILILWIAVKLFIEGAPEDGKAREAATIWQAIKIIVLADITMSLDNMLAVGGASHGNMFLLLFGLGLSIPFIVVTSNLLSTLMDKYPIIIYIGAAILGKVGGEMIMTDPFTVSILHPPHWAVYAVEALFAAGVIIAGKLSMRWTVRKEEEQEAIVSPAAEGAAPARLGAILTVSREFGSGGREIGLAVARELGYRYVDRETIFEDIRKDGPKWEEWAKDLDEHSPTLWEKNDWSYRGFVALMQWHLLEYAKEGGVVIMGRGGNFLLKDLPHAFRIHITAPLETRWERIMNRESLDRDSAKLLCEKTDHERARFSQAIYGKRWDDPDEYDRLFSVPGRSIDDVVSAVKKELLEREMLATDEARQWLIMLAAAAKIKAGIAVNPRFFIPVFDVLYNGREILLRGVTHTPREHKAIEEAARELAGGLPLRCELHYRK